MRLLALSAILFLFTSFLVRAAVQEDYSRFVDSKGQVSDLVIQCLGLSGIVIEGERIDKSWPEPHYTLKSGNLEDVVELIQGKVTPEVSWIKGGERWHMSNPLLSANTAKQVLKLGQEEFGFQNSTFPKEKCYEGVLVLGATAGVFRDRVLFTNELARKSVKFKKVYSLVGQRSLETFEKEAFPYLEGMDDEGQMVEEIFQEAANPTLQEKKVFVYSKAPEGAPRATAESNLHAFMTLNPKPGKYLCVSNGYYVPFQELTIQNALDKHYPGSGIKVECVGPASQSIKEDAPDEKVVNRGSVFLDNLSRILYNLDIRANLQKNN